LLRVENEISFNNSGWRGSQVVRQGSAKASSVGSIPTLASSSNCVCSKELGGSESQWLTVWLTTFGLFQDCFSIRDDCPAIA
jgi:hypothetical protein